MKIEKARVSAEAQGMLVCTKALGEGNSNEQAFEHRPTQVMEPRAMGICWEVDLEEIDG